MTLFVKGNMLARNSAEKEWHTKRIFEGNIKKERFTKEWKGYENYQIWRNNQGLPTEGGNYYPSYYQLLAKTVSAGAAEVVAMGRDSTSASLQVVT